MILGAVEGSYTKIVKRNKGETDAAMQDRVQSAVNQLRVSHQPLHEPLTCQRLGSDRPAECAGE